MTAVRHDCLPSPLLYERGLEPRNGPMPAESIEVCDLVDQNGNDPFASRQMTADLLDTFLRKASANPARPSGMRTEDGQHLVAFGRGQLFSFPPGCQPQGALDFTCPREDGLTERHLFEEEKGLGSWRYRMEVRKPDGRLIRDRQQILSEAGVTDAELTTQTTWHVGGRPFLAAADGWLHRFVESPDPWTPRKARHINIRYLNPYRRSPIFTDKTTRSFTIDSFTFDEPWQRDGFYRSLDRLVADHEVSFYPREKTAVIDGTAIHFEAPPDSPAVGHAELWDNLFGAVYLAPFLDLFSVESLTIFWGSWPEMTEMARQAGISLCLPAEDRDGEYCHESRTIFLKADPARYAQEALWCHGPDLRHEFGHALRGSVGDPLTNADFRGLVIRGLSQAGVPRGGDFVFLMRVVLDSPDIAALPEADKKRLDALWKKYQLGRFFPSRYSLSDQGEFFADLFFNWHPWHPYEADRLPIHGLFAAVDALRQGGTAAFNAELEVQYPNLEQESWGPPPVGGEATLSLDFPDDFGIPLVSVALLAVGFLAKWRSLLSPLACNIFVAGGLFGLVASGGLLAWQLSLIRSVEQELARTKPAASP